MVKPFNIEHVKTYRIFRFVLMKLKLATRFPGLSETVDMCERVGYCRFIDSEPKYNEPCIHLR